MQYLKGIINLSIVYKIGTNNIKSQSPYKLASYANSNYVNKFKDRKFVIRYYFFINGKVVLKYSKK